MDTVKNEIVRVAYNDNPTYKPARNWFVSLDSESWLGVASQEGETTIEDVRAMSPNEVRAIFAGNGRTRPMTMARRFLAYYMGGKTTFLDVDSWNARKP